MLWKLPVGSVWPLGLRENLMGLQGYQEPCPSRLAMLPGCHRGQSQACLTYSEWGFLPGSAFGACALMGLLNVLWPEACLLGCEGVWGGSSCCGWNPAIHNFQELSPTHTHETSGNTILNYDLPPNLSVLCPVAILNFLCSFIIP